MSYNKEKMVQLIFDECKSVEERCNGYKQNILDAIVEILQAEKDHKVQRTTIQKQVNQACHSAGDFLARKRNIENPTKTEVTR